MGTDNDDGLGHSHYNGDGDGKMDGNRGDGAGG